MTARGISNANFIGLLATSTVVSAAMPMLIILGGLAGLMLAPSPALATLPASVQTLAGLLATGPFSLFMGRYGRKAGFAVGGGLAIIGGMIGTLALYEASFIMLCLAHAFLGTALACYLYFRFAAAEIVTSAWQPVAISLMLTSGLVAALAGPQIFILAKDVLAPIPLAGAYAAISITTMLGLVPLAFVWFPASARSAGETAPDRRAAFAILRRGPVLSAVVIGAVSQGVMVLLMAPTPLAMIGCGFSETLAGDVIRWHVVAMFAPSFFTGFLIKRYGVKPVVVLGLMLLVTAGGAAASGLSAQHFYISLILLGVGWNFGFIGATTMLTSAVSPEERPVAQGANDTIIALAATLCTFASGAIVAGYGWTVLALVAVAIVLVATASMMLRQRAKTQPAE